MPALEFASYVIWSGITPLCSKFDQNCPVTIDGDFLRRKAEDLQRKVRSHWLCHGEPVVDRRKGEVDIGAINRKLDIIAARIAAWESCQAEYRKRLT